MSTAKEADRRIGVMTTPPPSPRLQKVSWHEGALMDRFADFLRRQIGTDLEKLRTMREDAEVGNSEMYPPNVFRGFRECEVKTRLLCMHEKCGTGNGPCDVIGQAFPLPDERGCQTRAILGMIYSDRPGYQARWQP